MTPMSWIWRGRLGARGRTAPRQRGQVMVLFAISLLVLVVAVGIAIDGGYGLYEYRQAQNAADFGAGAAAAELLPNCSDSGSQVDNATIASVIDDLVTRNSPSTSLLSGTGWVAYYLDSSGDPLYQPDSSDYFYVNTPGADTAEPGAAPTGACGVHVTVAPQWPAFMTQIIGFTTLKTAASAAAINAYTSGASNLTAIAALGEDGAHVIFEGGDGDFNVSGTIYDNSDGCLDSAKGCSPNWILGGQYDVIDGKQDGIMNVQGIIQSYVSNPFDWCFSPEPKGNGTSSTTISCSANADNTKISYYAYDGSDGAGSGGGQITGDPSNLPAPPSPSNAECSGESETEALNPAPSVSGSTKTYFPGVYTSPLLVDSKYNVVFDNCSQWADQSEPNPEAGMYFFEQGAVIQPPENYTVTGNDVLFVTAQAVPDSSLAQNTGDGEPPVGSGSGECDLEDTYEWCGNPNTGGSNPLDSADCGTEPAPVATKAAGTNCNAATKNPNSTSDQGLDYALELGGKGTINLTASTGTGFLWSDFLTWQLSGPVSGDSTVSAANVGLDGEESDTADINLTGILYNNSDQQGQSSSPQYWDGNAGIPYLPGGMLLAGYGVAGGPDGTGFSCGSYESTNKASHLTPAGGCDIDITGLAIVDSFQTEGFSTFKITGSPYEIAGIQGTGAILTQ